MSDAAPGCSTVPLRLCLSHPTVAERPVERIADGDRRARVRPRLQPRSPGDVGMLDDAALDENRPEPADFRTQGLEDIAEEPMGVKNPEWSLARREMWATAETYFSLLKKRPEGDEEVERIGRRLDELEARFSDNVAFHAFLQMERQATEGRDS